VTATDTATRRGDDGALHRTRGARASSGTGGDHAAMPVSYGRREWFGEHRSAEWQQEP